MTVGRLGDRQVKEQPPAPAPESPKAELASQESWTRRLRGFALLLLAPAFSLLLAAILGVLIIAAVQQSWAEVVDVGDAMWSYGLFGRDSLALILGRATPLILAGLAVAIAFRAGLFNLGVDGQYLLGALAAGYVGYRLSAPTAVRLPLTVLAGLAGGLLWAAVPALLKVYRGVHEAISTIMMSFVANAVLVSLLSGALQDPSKAPEVEPGAPVGSMVPFFNTIGFDPRGPAPPTWGFVLAIVAAAVYALTVRRTRFGFELRVLGTSPRAAEPSGIRSNALIIKVMLVSGLLAGLTGLQDVLATDGPMTLDDVRGYGLTAIAVALLGRNSGLGIVAAALLFSFLDRASFGIGLNTDVAREVTGILQGVIVLTVVIAYEVVRRMTDRRQLKDQDDRA
jgi:general nucleoside transport system permease protein